jgi:DGQHR domain-containing protein
MTRVLTFPVLSPRQSERFPVFSFTATADEIVQIARIERAGRDQEGALRGFQRPQIAGHIDNIADYLDKPHSILPNGLVVGFTRGVKTQINRKGSGIAMIDTSKGPPGWIVDGQQRFTALSRIENRDFQVIVTGFICPTIQELQRQFILINSARPLPKALVYELLPQVPDLPPTLLPRALASRVTETLNYKEGSSLKGLIKQQTNPNGIIADVAVQKLILNSMNDGALRLYVKEPKKLVDRGSTLISEFFHAVKHTFRNEWDDHTPKTSRLVHGTGIVAMGYVMETLNSANNAQDRDEFASGLRPLVGKTSWTDGNWDFGAETRSWNSIQNVPRDVRQLSMYLVQVVKRGSGRRSARV